MAFIVGFHRQEAIPQKGATVGDPLENPSGKKHAEY